MEFVQKRLTRAHAGEENTEIKDKDVRLSAAWSEKYARNALAVHHDEKLCIGRQSRQMTVLEMERELSIEEEFYF